MNKYMLEKTLLKRGDVILTKNKGVVSAAIRCFTWSRFSHAAIYVGSTTVEATLKGVFTKNPQRMIFDNAFDVAVYRSKKKLGESEIDKICSYAQAQVGSLYALNEAITMRARLMLRLSGTKKQFCSRLVANSYAYIGYDFINLPNPEYCTPKKLGACDAFELVGGVVREASVNEIELGTAEDPSRENFKNTYCWLNNVRKYVNSTFRYNVDIQTINDVCEFLLKNPGLDSKISGFVESSGYLTFANKARKIDAIRYDVERLTEIFINADDAFYMLGWVLDDENEMLYRFSKNFDDYLNYYNKSNLVFF